ncbi:MAG: nucleotide exchange factor GrpE [Lachnospiraceae bacterium]|nr:nucleotide exchange factor GrpE [Lachnospiraceae bacterium]
MSKENMEEVFDDATEEANTEETVESTEETNDETVSADAGANDEAVEETEETANEETEDSEGNKKKLFGKKKDKKDEMLEELTDKHQRLMAEFQNFRNRTDKEKAMQFELGAKSVIEKLLPIMDNFERGLAALSEEDLNSPVGQGMSMIYKQCESALTDMGVEVIQTEGCEFDPELHNAVMHIDDEELGENVIAEEFQKGYTYRGTVVRHSMVKVAN